MADSLKDLDLEGVQNILGRTLIDSQFREELLADPAKTVENLGYKQSEESERFFKSLDNDSFKGIAQDIGNRTAPASIIGGGGGGAWK